MKNVVLDFDKKEYMEKLQNDIISDFAVKLDISTGDDSQDQIVKKVAIPMTPPTMSGIVTPYDPSKHTNQSLEKDRAQPCEPSSFKDDGYHTRN